ncbi:putative quinol monooxygenase [Nakamurella leprariae]|uniref:Antibiotic biosynthesis monooxygenase n=1 Tax=Nakamurella leprariae TaxID=2803911 RepID=A0A938Y8E5_9ACTN|nr:putative quinol monooxygenase [Nakamurella leprariae]MBM9467926.1 antibiotic biosynthesis monooxygenase [Nakamurella leprariae]
MTTASNPIVVVAVFTPAEGKKEELTALFTEAVAKVHTEPGCHLYSLHESSDGNLIFIEKWESADALQVHSTAPALTEVGPKLGPLLGAAPQVTTMTAIPAGDATKGAL